MKLIHVLYLTVILCVLTGCSNRQLIVTDQTAFFLDDDSLNVVSCFSKTDSLAKADEDTIGDVRPIPIRTISAKYPEHPGKYYLAGEVWVKMRITVDGNVSRACIKKSTDPMFNKPSLEAAMQWKFKPAIIKGKETAVWITVPFVFRLHKNGISYQFAPKDVNQHDNKIRIDSKSVRSHKNYVNSQAVNKCINCLYL